MFQKIALAGLAAALLFAAVPAQAALTNNGRSIQGTHVNGRSIQGVSVNGGTQHLRVIGVELPATAN